MLPHRSWTAYPPAGTVIFVVTWGVFKHKGIVSDRWWNGKPMVLANSPRSGVVEQSWDEFVGSQEAFILNGFISNLPVLLVMQRARALLGRPYELFNYNCDHYVNEAHGRPVVSEQLGVIAAVVGLMGVAAAFGARA